jgi:hypothetical protein
VQDILDKYMLFLSKTSYHNPLYTSLNFIFRGACQG